MTQTKTKQKIEICLKIAWKHVWADEHPLAYRVSILYLKCQFSQQYAKKTVLAYPLAKYSTARLKNSTDVSAPSASFPTMRNYSEDHIVDRISCGYGHMVSHKYCHAYCIVGYDMFLVHHSCIRFLHCVLHRSAQGQRFYCGIAFLSQSKWSVNCALPFTSIIYPVCR